MNDALKKKAKLGDADAQCNLALCYARAKDVKKSIAEAVEWLKINC